MVAKINRHDPSCVGATLGNYNNKASPPERKTESIEEFINQSCEVSDKDRLDRDRHLKI